MEEIQKDTERHVVVQRLNELSSKLNTRYEIVEGELKKLSFGVPHWSHVDGKSSIQLGYDKPTGFQEWGLYIKRGDLQVWRAVHAPRLYRIKALSILDSMIDGVTHEAAILVKQLEEALKDD